MNTVSQDGITRFCHLKLFCIIDDVEKIHSQFSIPSHSSLRLFPKNEEVETILTRQMFISSISHIISYMFYSFTSSHSSHSFRLGPHKSTFQAITPGPILSDYANEATQQFPPLLYHTSLVFGTQWEICKLLIEFLYQKCAKNYSLHLVNQDFTTVKKITVWILIPKFHSRFTRIFPSYYQSKYN